MMRFLSPVPCAARRVVAPALAAALSFGHLAFPDTVRAQHLEVPVHDPVMTRDGDEFYLYTTGRGVAAWRSPDLTNWERLPAVHAVAPEWTEAVVDGFARRNHMWAPDIVHHQGTFYLYYSVSAFGQNTSAIGVATNTTLNPADPDYAWVDRGGVVESVPGRDLWNAIDPNIAFDDDGTPWMTFGSFWMGLKLVKLDDDMVSLAEPQEWYTVAARERTWPSDDRRAGSGVIEAPFIFRKDGRYYLFVSLGRCCAGAESTYHVAVGRADSITGPYLDREGLDLAHGGGTIVLSGDENYAGIGHSAAYTFDGIDHFVAHAYDLRDDGRSKLMIRRISWDAEGWPTVSLED